MKSPSLLLATHHFHMVKFQKSLSISGSLWSGITYNLRQFCNSIPNLKRFEESNEPGQIDRKWGEENDFDKSDASGI